MSRIININDAISGNRNNNSKSKNQSENESEYYYLSGFCKKVKSSFENSSYGVNDIIIFYAEDVTEQINKVHENDVSNLIKNHKNTSDSDNNNKVSTKKTDTNSIIITHEPVESKSYKQTKISDVKKKVAEKQQITSLSDANPSIYIQESPVITKKSAMKKKTKNVQIEIEKELSSIPDIVKPKFKRLKRVQHNENTTFLVPTATKTLTETLSVYEMDDTLLGEDDFMPDSLFNSSILNQQQQQNNDKQNTNKQLQGFQQEYSNLSASIGSRNGSDIDEDENENENYRENESESEKSNNLQVKSNSTPLSQIQLNVDETSQNSTTVIKSILDSDNDNDNEESCNIDKIPISIMNPNEDYDFDDNDNEEVLNDSNNKRKIIDEFDCGDNSNENRDEKLPEKNFDTKLQENSSNNFDYQLIVQQTHSVRRKKGTSAPQRREYEIFGELCTEITSPFLKFIIKVKSDQINTRNFLTTSSSNGNKNGNNIFRLHEIIYVLFPPKRTYTLKRLRDEALKSEYYGHYFFRSKQNKKKIKNDEEDGSDIEVTSDEDGNNNKNHNSNNIELPYGLQLFQNNKDINRVHNRKVSNCVGRALSEFKINVGKDYKTLLTQQNTTYIKDVKMNFILKNIFKDIRYFFNMNTFGKKIYSTLSYRELQMLNLAERTDVFIETPDFNIHNFVATFEKLSWKFRITEACLKYVTEINENTLNTFEMISRKEFHEQYVDNNNENVIYTGCTKESVIKHFHVVQTATNIYHDLIDKNRSFGHTCIMENQSNSWDQDVIAFFKQIDSQPVNAQISLIQSFKEGNQNKYGITLKSISDEEQRCINLLVKLKSKIMMCSVPNDDENEKSGYGQQIYQFIESNKYEMRDVLIVTCCERRLQFLKTIINQYAILPQMKCTDVVYINNINNYNLIGKKMILLDRSHKTSLKQFVSLFNKICDNTTVFDTIFYILICGNQDLFPDTEGQVFRDMFESNQFRTLKWSSNLNKRKIVEGISDIKGAIQYIKNKKINVNNIMFITCNKDDMNGAYDDLCKNGITIDRRLKMKSLTTIDINNLKDILLADLIIFYATYKYFSQYQLYKLMDVSTINKQSIIIISNNVPFNSTLDISFIPKFSFYRNTNFGELIVSSLYDPGSY